MAGRCEGKGEMKDSPEPGDLGRRLSLDPPMLLWPGWQPLATGVY